MNDSFHAALAAGLLLGTVPFASAGDIPPAGAKPLSEVIKSVAAADLGVITEAECDDGLWEITFQKDARQITLFVDPVSMKEKRRKQEDDSSSDVPPTDAKPLAEILRSVEAGGSGAITEVEFDDGVWEVEVYQNKRKQKLYIDPATGNPRAAGPGR